MSPDAYSPFISRRSLLGGAVAVAMLNSAQASSGSAPATPARHSLDELRMLLRMTASIDAAMSPWYYTGRITAVRAGEVPLHLYDFEGTEINWTRRLADNRWSMGVSTLTFFRDKDSGAFLDRFLNPVTGKRVDVQPNVLRSPPGKGVFYSERGMTLFEQTAPLDVAITRHQDLVWLTKSRSIRGSAPQPSMDVATMFSRSADLDDTRRASVPAHFSSTSLSAWSRWLDMEDVEGHLVWHGCGRKLASLDALPAEYRQRADALKSRHFSDPELDPLPTPRA